MVVIKHCSIPTTLDQWVKDLLAHPVSKQRITAQDLPKLMNADGLLDARIYLKNTHGYDAWSKGQNYFESWEANSLNYGNEVKPYHDEILRDRVVYEHFSISGSVLDVGGLTGAVREFLPVEVRYVSVDPFVDAVRVVPPAKFAAYSCLQRPLNFIGAFAEFLPFVEECFDWVHMRSMLDHVQVPDLAMLEAARVLKKDGQLLVGLNVDSSGNDLSFRQRCKSLAKDVLGGMGFRRYVDFHTWRPSFDGLTKLLSDGQFVIEDVFWQPGWDGQVVYIRCRKG